MIKLKFNGVKNEFVRLEVEVYVRDVLSSIPIQASKQDIRKDIECKNHCSVFFFGCYSLEVWNDIHRPKESVS